MSLPAPPAGFSVPDFSAPLDIDALIARLPVHASVKGTIAQSTVDALRATGRAPAKSYIPFRDYPMRELIELNVGAVRELYPGVPEREGLRRLGRLVFPAFVQTLIGRVMYGVFGSNVGSVFKLANKSFELTQNTGRVTTMSTSGTAVTMRFVNTHTFLSSYHFGILEGTLQALGVGGQVTYRAQSDTDGEFFVAWEARV